MIQLSVPNFEGNEEKYVLDALKQGWVSTAGAYVQKFETQLAAYSDSPLCAVCQNGTAALHLSLVECGISAGDIVLVPTLTFIAAVNPVKYLNATPIFMDCDDSLCIDAYKLEKFCEEECKRTSDGLVYKKTGKCVRALIVVHVFGNWADMEGIMDVAEKFGISVIEDATEALGTICNYGRYKGKMAGTVADFGAYSFNGNKIITTGGGGAVVGRNAEAVKHIKYLTSQAKDDDLFYVHNEVGYNYRMTNVQAAIGVAQLEELEEFIDRKNRNYNLYAELLKNCKIGRLLPFRGNVRANKWFYSFVLDKNICTADIKSYVLSLKDKGVQTRPVWGLIHEQKPYKAEIAYEIEKALDYSNRILNLPCSTSITTKQIEEVCKCINEMETGC